jgi:hypothetical protein
MAKRRGVRIYLDRLVRGSVAPSSSLAVVDRAWPQPVLIPAQRQPNPSDQQQGDQDQPEHSSSNKLTQGFTQSEDGLHVNTGA